MENKIKREKIMSLGKGRTSSPLREACVLSLSAMVTLRLKSFARVSFFERFADSHEKFPFSYEGKVRSWASLKTKIRAASLRVRLGLELR